MNHPVHPRCKCGKPLYKAFQKGKSVKKTDPWAYCRNEACNLSGPEGIAADSKDIASIVESAEDAKFKARLEAFREKQLKDRDLRREQAANEAEEIIEPAQEPPKLRKLRARPAEPEHMRKAREALRPLVKRIAPEGADKVSIGLVLAILNQESGSREAANLLIEQYKLDEKFGMMKF